MGYLAKQSVPVHCTIAFEILLKEDSKLLRKKQFITMYI